jgi:uroporphyrinogen-III synthase
LDAELRHAGGAATVLARGPKARSAAIGAGLDVHWQAPGETGAEVVEHLRDIGIAGRRVVVQRDGGEALLADRIRQLGADVVDVPVYRWQVPDDHLPARRLVEAGCTGRLDAVTFTCAYAVGSTFAIAPDPEALRDALAGPVKAVAVGPVCAAALRRHGVERAVEPRRPRLGAIVQALVVALTADHRVLRLGSHERRWQGSALVDGADGDSRVTNLTPSERRILETLVRRGARSVVPKSSLVDEGVDAHAAEAAVGRLRAKLGPLGAAIRTVPSRGYLCTLEVA